MSKADVDRLMRAYPKIYFACHAQHRRDPETGERLPERQASVLDHLDPKQAVALNELADHFGVTPATMSLTVSRLVKGGYVRRRRAREDMRRLELTLSDRGVRMKEAMRVLDPERVHELLAQLNDDERTKALAGLEILASNAETLVSSWSKRLKETM